MRVTHHLKRTKDNHEAVRRYAIILGVIAALVLFGLWWFSAEQVVKRRVTSLFETAEVPESMASPGRLARGTHVAKYVADRVRVRPPTDARLPISLAVPISRDNVSQYYSATAKYARSITFEDLTFKTVEIIDDEAKVSFSIDGIVDLPSRRPVDGILHVESVWRKIEGDWLLVEFSWQEQGR